MSSPDPRGVEPIGLLAAAAAAAAAGVDTDDIMLSSMFNAPPKSMHNYFQNLKIIIFCLAIA